MNPHEEAFSVLFVALVSAIAETLAALEARVRELELAESRALHCEND